MRKSHSPHEFQRVARELGRAINPPLQGTEIPSEKAPYEPAPESLRSPDQIFAVIGYAPTIAAFGAGFAMLGLWLRYNLWRLRPA